MKPQRFLSLRPDIDLPEFQANFKNSRVQQDAEGRSWYSVRNVTRNEAEVLIYDEIGMWGVTASDFIRDLGEIKAQQINLRINSPGGDVFDGVAIYNAVKRHTSEITVYVDGLAASAASFIAMAGDTVMMSPHSQMMIHDAAGFAMGNAADMRKLADILDNISDTIASIYAEKAGGTADSWRETMKAETWYTDQSAVDAGLADAIVGKEPQNVIRNESPPVSEEPSVEEPEAPAAVIEPIPAAINWGTVFQEAVSMAEDDLFAPVQEAV